MALAVRELELILIARDHASATIARVGGALTIMGGALVLAGIRATREFGEMARESMEFERTIALAVTQADGLGATIENVGDIVNRVGTNINVPFDELTESLYDIFSTFTSDQLSSLEDAEVILNAFGESAIAGNAPIRDIGRSVIAWINALDQPASLENVNRILDIQFELVRKGAGTYGEFADQVGKAIPAFVAAGQTTETFGGALAFLTKNGLSAAMASTSAARAVELMYAPKAIKGLTDIGVAVEDSEGKFRSMVDIIRDLQPVFADLSDAESKIKFKEIFGTGRIQARRFFDLVMPNFAEFEELVGDMENSAGGVADAFELMFSQPLSQMELFKNKWELLRRELGETFVEKIETKVFPALNRFFDWWDNLDDEMKENIATWLLWSAAIMIGVGALMALMGIGLLFIALLKAFGGGSALIGLGKILLSLGWIGLILGIIAGLAYLVWKNWDKIKPFLMNLWEDVKKKWAAFVEWIKPYWDKAVERAKVTWGKIVELGTVAWERAKSIWGAIWRWMLRFWEKWGEDIWGTAKRIWGHIVDIFWAAWDVVDGIIDFFIALFEGDWEGMWEAVKDVVKATWDIIVGLFRIASEIISQVWRILWDWIKRTAATAWNAVFKFLKGIWNKIKKTASNIWNGIVDFFKGIWDSIVGTAKDTIDGKGGLLIFFQELPGKILDAIVDFGTMLIEWIGEALGGLFRAAGEFVANTLMPFFSALPGRIVRAIPGALTALWNAGWEMVKGLWNGIKWYWDTVVFPFWTNLFPKILGAIGATIGWLWNKGWDILSGLWKGIIWVWDNLMYPWLVDLGPKVVEGIGDVTATLLQAGKDILTGMWDGITAIWTDFVAPWWEDLDDLIVEILGNMGDILRDIGGDLLEGMYNGVTSWWTDTFMPWWDNLPELIRTTIGDTIETLKQRGRDLLQGMYNGAKEWWNNTFMPWWRGLPDRIRTVVGNTIATLKQRGKDIIVGFWNGAKDFWNNTVKGWFSGRRGVSISQIGSTINTLWDRGFQIIKGFYNGALNFMTYTLLPWIRSLPKKAWDALWNVSDYLSGKGESLLRGFFKGVTDFWHNTAYYWFHNLGSKVKSAVGSLTRTLYWIGRGILQGLWDGMKDKWDSVSSWLGGLGRKISAKKGPYDVDLKLLVDNGTAIMRGLEKGMQLGFSRRIEPMLKGFTQDDISNLIGSGTFDTGGSVTNNNENGQTFQFGDIISQATPEDIAAAISWELRMA